MKKYNLFKISEQSFIQNFKFQTNEMFENGVGKNKHLQRKFNSEILIEEEFVFVL
jgi:hypothetical protein